MLFWLSPTHIFTAFCELNRDNRLEKYALKASRCSQQLHAIANPSEEDVALPNSSTTIRLLQTEHKATFDIIDGTKKQTKD